jgi:HAD domain in Swiss Army Knife RNA repair proteins
VFLSQAHQRTRGSPGSGTDVIGLTPSVHKGEVTRDDEIASWLKANGNVEALAIVDDDDVHPFAAYHVKTDKQVGLTKPDSDWAVELLFRAELK